MQSTHRVNNLVLQQNFPKNYKTVSFSEDFANIRNERSPYSHPLFFCQHLPSKVDSPICWKNLCLRHPLRKTNHAISTRLTTIEQSKFKYPLKILQVKKYQTVCTGHNYFNPRLLKVCAILYYFTHKYHIYVKSFQLFVSW